MGLQRDAGMPSPGPEAYRPAAFVDKIDLPLSTPTDDTWEDLEPQRALLIYRALRHVALVSGLALVDEPLFFAKDRLIRNDPDVDRWDALAVGATTAPGYELLRAILESDGGAFSTQPPAIPPIDGIPAQEPPLIARQARFWELLAASGRFLGFSQAGSLGLDVSAPEILSSHPETRRALYCHFPSDERLREVELNLMMELSLRLAGGSEDAIRGWLVKTLPCTQFEAFGLVQSARRWAAAMRPLDPDVERALVLRELDRATDDARLAGDHRAIIAATVARARVAGLLEHKDRKGSEFEEAMDRFREFVLEQESSVGSIEAPATETAFELPESVTSSPFAPLPEQ